jgi:hypothetical protein
LRGTRMCFVLPELFWMSSSRFLESYRPGTLVSGLLTCGSSAASAAASHSNIIRCCSSVSNLLVAIRNCLSQHLVVFGNLSLCSTPQIPRTFESVHPDSVTESSIDDFYVDSGT